MADNTTLFAGSGGDVLRTDDVGGGVKVAVSKIHTGGDGSDGGPVTAVNPLDVAPGDGSSRYGLTNPMPVRIYGVTDGSGRIIGGATDPEGHIEVSIQRPRSAFGEVLVAKVVPTAQVSFVYGILSETTSTYTANGGTATSPATSSAAGARIATAASGTNAAGLSFIYSRRRGHYREGQGNVARWTAMHSAPAANSTLVSGPIDLMNGYGFGYNGTSFGILRRTNGQREIQTLTITAAASGAQNATVTLEGNAVTVTGITNAGGVQSTTASQVAAIDYSNTGSGWDAYQNGATVVFVCRQTGNKTGTFSFSHNSATGTFAETTAGRAPDDTWVPQASWNGDVCDGSSSASNPSAINLDQTKLLPYGVDYQYLGAGDVYFYVENRLNGQLVLVHTIRYADTDVVTNVQQPSLPISWIAQNTGSTTSVSVSGASGMVGVEGEIHMLGPKWSAQNNKTLAATTLTNLFTVRCAPTYGLTVSGAQILLRSFSAASITGTGLNYVQVIRGATVGGTPNFTSPSAQSAIEIDTAGTTVSGGTVLWSSWLTNPGNVTPDPSIVSIFAEAGERLTVAAFSTAGSPVVGATIGGMVDV